MLEIRIEFESPVGEGERQAKLWREGNIWHFDEGVALAHQRAKDACATGVPFTLRLFSPTVLCAKRRGAEPLRYELEILRARPFDHGNPRRGYAFESLVNLVPFGIAPDALPAPGGVHIVSLERSGA